MSKSLEAEYINLIADDIPDLWDRIESGLEERTPNIEKIPEKRPELDTLTAEEMEAVAEQTRKTNQKASSRFHIYLPAIAAAAVFAIVVAPVLLLVNRANKNAETTDNTMNFAAMASYEEAAACDEEAKADYSYCEEAAEPAMAEDQYSIMGSTVGFAKPRLSEENLEIINQALTAQMSEEETPNDETIGLTEKDSEIATNIKAYVDDNGLKHACIMEGVAIEIQYLLDEDGVTKVAGYYKEDAQSIIDGFDVTENKILSGNLSEESELWPEENLEYISDVYLCIDPDGGYEYEYVIQSSRR